MEYYNKVNQTILLPYVFGYESGLNRKLTFNEEWIQMIEDHTVTILGWIQLEKVRWLQNNNPEIPGLVYKLAPMNEKMRKLEHVRLMPMDSALNSSKSNHLPEWEPFVKRFAGNQYIMYDLIYEKGTIRKFYEACYRDNLHSIWANRELYRKGNTKEEFYSILDKNMRPVYDSARRQGYEIWKQHSKVSEIKLI